MRRVAAAQYANLQGCLDDGAVIELGSLWSVSHETQAYVLRLGKSCLLSRGQMKPIPRRAAMEARDGVSEVMGRPKW